MINRATSRFDQVYQAYLKDKDVTKERIYIETVEQIFSNVEKVIIDGEGGASGVVPYLPLKELSKSKGVIDMASFRLATIVVLLAGAFVLYNSAFTVNQTQQALVLQLGDPKRTIQEPGLAFKLPFIQDVTYYEKRVLSLIPQDAQEVILSDQKRLMVDAYARYKITDPLLFYQTVRNENGARGRLEAIIDSSVRRALGNETLGSIFTGQRNDITRSIGDEVNQSVVSLGIQIIDVRLRRADYPEATSQNIFNRMKSERTREAKEFRATGEEEAQKIRSAAEKTRMVIISEAQQIAQETRGGGDS